MIFKGICKSEAASVLEKQGPGFQNKGKADKFLVAKFRQQMKELMEELGSCDVNFIR